MWNAHIDELAIKLAQILEKNKLTISCAESCTGGGLAYAMTSVAGSSSWFNQSFVTYSNEAKEALLKVSANTLANEGAVSQSTVEQMAKGCARAACADIAISISGIAGPGGGTEEKPVGLVWFGFYLRDEVVTEQCIFSGDRTSVRLQAIEFSLNTVIRLIENSK